MTNPHEIEARTRKAVTLATGLDALGVSPDAAAEWTEAQRDDFAQTLGVRKPSDATWTMAVQGLRVTLQVRSEFAPDPFAGLNDYQPERPLR